MTRLSDVLETVGGSLARLVAGPDPAGIDVAGVVIHDPTDPPPLGRGTMVLAVGLGRGQEMTQLLDRVAGEGAVLVVKLAGPPLAALAEEADAAVAVVAIAAGADWVQVASFLRSAIAEEGVGGEGEQLGGVAAGDLFSVANAVAALIDAPVTIEDPQSRVIAYSARQDEADEARMITILGRQVPESYHRKLQSDGVFRRLNREHGAIYLDDIGPGVLPRLAVAVRAGDQYLGSIWAAVKKRPAKEKIDDFAEAANFVAIHLLRHRLEADIQRGLQADLVSAVLTGAPLAGDAASRLGLRGEAFRVIAVGMREGDAVDNESALARCWDTLSLHLSVSHRRAPTGLVGGIVYAVLPVPADGDGGRRLVRQAVDGYLARLAAPLRGNVVVAVGGPAKSLAEVPRSRMDADRVLMVLRRSARGNSEVGEIEDMRMEVLLHRLAELASEDPLAPSGPLAAVLEHDAAHGTHFVATLRAYLDAFGDIARAADMLQVHHNTLRYRLQKLRQVPGVNLDDSEQRLSIQLQLRLMPELN